MNLLIHDFAAFKLALAAELGPEVGDGPYILWRHPNARVVDLPCSKVDLIPLISNTTLTR